MSPTPTPRKLIEEHEHLAKRLRECVEREKAKKAEVAA